MKTVLSTLLLFIGISLFAQKQAPFQLIELPYPTNAFGPVISSQTIELHHGKHLKGYVDNLNKLVAGTAYENMSLEEIVASSEGALFNNAGQTLNHNLYFTQLSPNARNVPEGPLADAINKQWGSFSKFKEAFLKACGGVFGSGWVWLAKDKNGDLQIVPEANAGNPITKGMTPLMGLDVWEHAYYIDYQNRRADHLNSIWNVIDWSVVEKRY